MMKMMSLSATTLVFCFSTISVGQEETFTPLFPFVEDFDGPIDDSNPVTWADGLLTDGAASLNNGDFILSGSSMSQVVISNNDYVVADNASMQAQLTLGGTNPSAFAAIFTRGATQGSPLGYFGGIRKGGDIFVGEIFDDGTNEAIEFATDLRPESHDVVIQLDAFGSELTISAWDARIDRPLTPVSVSITDDTLTSGIFGIGVGGGNNSVATYRSFQVVPEPSSSILLLVGLLGVQTFRRNRHVLPV